MSFVVDDSIDKPSGLRADAVRSAKAAFDQLPRGDAIFQQCLQDRDPIGAVVEILSNDSRTLRRKKSTRFLLQFQRYTQWLKNISSVVDTAVQTQAGLLCPIWAPLKFILQVSHKMENVMVTQLRHISRFQTTMRKLRKRFLT